MLTDGPPSRRAALASATAALAAAGTAAALAADGHRSASDVAPARPAAIVASPARATTERLSPTHLAGARVVTPLRGTRPSRAERRLIARGEVAGVVLFGRNVRSTAQVRRLTRTLQRIRRPAPLRRFPLLVLVDQEGGPVRRLPGEPDRSAPQLGRRGSVRAARAEGRQTAATLRAAGANVDLAPVADVARRGAALEREGRTFGRDPDVVARLATAFARGLEDGGVAATLKHFPGFGAAPANTDDRAVRIGLSRERLAAVDEPPFRAGIAAGADLVMVASAVYPALDRRRPAVLAPAVHDRLRDRLGFTGVSVTDDLETPALAPEGSVARVAVQAADAGADLLLYASRPGAAADARRALTRALRAGRLDRATAEAAAARVLDLRAELRDRVRARR